MKKLQKPTIAEIALLCVAAVFLATFLRINFKGFTQFATGDVYSDTLYAMEAWKSKSVFPDGWVFGNQFYVVATPVLCALLYGVTGRINLSMILATTVMTALLIGSLIWMLRPAANRLQQIAAVTVLLGGMTTCEATASPEGQLLFLLASYYSCYLITLFLTVGDYLRTLREPRRPLYRGMTVLCYLLLAATGMQSLRQTAILALPLAVLEILRLAVRLIRDRRLEKDTFRITGRVGLYCLFNLAGLILIRLLEIPNVSIYGETLLRTSDWAGAHEINLRILGKITGFYYALHQPHGWLYLIPALLFCGLTVLSVILGAVRFFKTKRADLLFLIQLLLIIGLIGLFAANLLLEMSFRTPYMFTWYALLGVSAAALFRDGRRESLIAAALVVGCCFNWLTGYGPAMKALQEPAEVPYDEIAAFLVKNDYRYLYGEWYSAAMTALYTDGEVLACASDPSKPFRILPYINPQDRYGAEENAQAAYLFTRQALQPALDYAAGQGAVMTQIATFSEGEYLLYTSDRPLMYHE